MRDNLQGLQFLFANRKLLLIAAGLGAVIGVSRTFFIPKKYLSTAIIYPVNTHTRTELISNPQFGFDVETEQLLQLLESQSMRDRTIEEFNLSDYYELDTINKGWRTKLAEKYINDVDFLRSKYLSVVINVKSTNPELSAKIANFQVQEVDKYRQQIFRNNREEEFNYVNSKYHESKERLEVLEDSIYMLKGGDAQLLSAFIENLNNENYDASVFIDSQNLESIVESYRFELLNFRELRKDRHRNERAMAQPMPKVYSIDKAVPSYKKVSPSFVINALVGASVLFMLSLSIRLVYDRSKKLKQATA